MEQAAKDLIVLDFCSSTYEMELEDYSLPADQLKFTATPKEAITQSKMDGERYPVVILCRNIPIGFLVLHDWNGAKQYTNNRRAILVRAYSIDSRYQGKGYAKQSLKLLTAFVKKHFPNKNEIILAVYHKNTVAQNLYRKSGFTENGTRLMGRKGELIVMSKVITNELLDPRIPIVKSCSL
ncbi:GNAT family N-acetyltransferase [Virgibacillus oceani]|nr:GNAT family protein [Virgibacillus oceani]